MLLETLQTAAIQVTPVIALIWAASRFLSPRVQVWLWRLVFLRLTVGLLLWPTFNVPVLPPVAMEYGAVDATYVPPPDPFPIWQALWFAGVAVLALVALKETWQARRLVVESHRETPTESNPQLPAGNFRISDRAKVPMVIGLLRPTILIPRELAETATAEELRMIVAHEQGHIAHGDLFWAWLIWAGRAAFFFHPLVWVAARCERFAREAAADRFAIERSGADPHGYGQVLMRITLADPLTSSLSPAGLTMSDSYRFIYRRLETMKTFSKRPTLGRLISTGALCAITFGLLPAFNFVPAAAQAPLDSATEPVAYPIDDDAQAVAQSPTVVLVQNKTAKKSQSKKVNVKLQAAKPASGAKTSRVINLQLAPAIAVPAAPAAAPAQAITIVPPRPVQMRVENVQLVPAAPATAPAIAIVPARPAQMQVENVRLVPAAPSAAPAIAVAPPRPGQVQVENVRYIPLTPRPAAPPRPSQVRFKVALPARAPSAPSKSTIRYKVALPASAPATAPSAAPAPAPSAPVQIAAPAAQPRLKRTTNTYQKGGVTKYNVTLSRPLSVNPTNTVNVVTNSQLDASSTVQATAPVTVVSGQTINVQTQVEPVEISTSVNSTNARPGTHNIQPVKARTLRISTQPTVSIQRLKTTAQPVTKTLLLVRPTVTIATTNRMKLDTVKLIPLKPIKSSRKISTTTKKKN